MCGQQSADVTNILATLCGWSIIANLSFNISRSYSWPEQFEVMCIRVDWIALRLLGHKKILTPTEVTCFSSEKISFCGSVAVPLACALSIMHLGSCFSSKGWLKFKRKHCYRLPDGNPLQKSENWIWQNDIKNRDRLCTECKQITPDWPAQSC